VVKLSKKQAIIIVIHITTTASRTAVQWVPGALPQYVFTGLCSVRHRDNFTFTIATTIITMPRAFQRFTGEVKTVHGMEAYRFTFPENSLDNGEVIPENKCFCRKGKCLPAGLIDVHDCYYGER
jgi:hypothetical protein